MNHLVNRVEYGLLLKNQNHPLINIQIVGVKYVDLQKKHLVVLNGLSMNNNYHITGHDIRKIY